MVKGSWDHFEKSRNKLFKKMEQNHKEFITDKSNTETKEKPTNIPSYIQSKCSYYIENLTRRPPILTETTHHIHTSLHLFKRYLSSLHLAKPRIPDPRIPP
jgi:hypothetical protein